MGHVHAGDLQVFISTSTPADRSSFISASSVCCVGSRMSSKRLWVRISNCSRLFFSTCGERSPGNLLIRVGSGIGPATRAPVRLAVSTISPALWSSSFESYAFSRILIFCVAIDRWVLPVRLHFLSTRAGWDFPTTAGLSQSRNDERGAADTYIRNGLQAPR